MRGKSCAREDGDPELSLCGLSYLPNASFLEQHQHLAYAQSQYYKQLLLDCLDCGSTANIPETVPPDPEVPPSQESERNLAEQYEKVCRTLRELVWFFRRSQVNLPLEKSTRLPTKKMTDFYYPFG
jgi:hypothetical protein